MMDRTRPHRAAAAPPERVGEGVWRVTSGAFPSNAYICATGVPGEAFLIDPGLDPQQIDHAAQELGLAIRQVICTHGHFDHIGGASHFQEAYGAQVYLHAADVKTMRSANFLLMVLKLEQRVVLPKITPVDPAAQPQAAPPPYAIFHHVPGHTPGSCFLQYGKNLFTGDSLYARGVGLSDLPGEDHRLLRKSLLAVWDMFPGDCTVYPGHGPSARFDEIRTGNASLLAFLAADEAEDVGR